MTGEPRELHGAWNFRDVSDTPGALGVLRPGRLFRSSELTRLDDLGRDELHRLGITDVADLRSRREVARRGPGLVPAGVDIHLLPFPDLGADGTDSDAPASPADSPGSPDQAGRDDQGGPHEQAFRRIMAEKPDGESIRDAVTRYMADEYRHFPLLGGSLRAVHRVITLLTAGRPVLAHCFAGKDRTGFVVATVLEAAGVDRDLIVADYLRSNAAVPELRARIMEMIQRPDAPDTTSGTELTPEVVTFTEARLSDEVLGVQADYLAAARQTIDDSYGSLNGYLRRAGVTGADVDRLRSTLLA